MRTESLYKHFMLTQVSHIPVIDEASKLIGFLSKEKLQIEMSDLSRSSMEIESIPEGFIDKDLSETLISYFSIHGKIPVIDLQGTRKDSWDKPRLLAEYSKMATNELAASELESEQTVRNRSAQGDRNSESRADQKESKEKNPVQWFMQLILESFSDPLFATDLDGHTIFYNEKFEKGILSQPHFRNSVSFAERFLRDLNKDVFAGFLKANDLDINASNEHGKVLQTLLPKIGYMVRIVTLSQADKMVGYLYHFSLLRQSIQNQNDEGFVFPSLEEAFANKLPLELVLKETESFYIYQSLLRNHRNVSHTSDELGIPRSTLQNRIRFLELEKRFSNHSKDPIPRKRAPQSRTKKNESTTKPTGSEDSNSDNRKSTSQKQPASKKKIESQSRTESKLKIENKSKLETKSKIQSKTKNKSNSKKQLESSNKINRTKKAPKKKPSKKAKKNK
ncbi:transcriptional regulator [Leptospira sp. GIMC2001]|uniref:transcriptional regulator n=1 Tax=Leptospira sp. GIMC2001 TaxID=1513297 RepID=UPI00234A64C5|nr:transcriptional regulator [Leptospira sp. GIMC2001]WCL50862.1 transcriptional regulator [Leptospira sp. GIMC2001]